MTPWRKRFHDYEQLVNQAVANYFNPDLFRLNVNNAIATARTVTFVMQNNKRPINGFDVWYEATIQQPLKTDPVMLWAKDSRNTIEKQGDLDLHSECWLELVFSYTQAGPRISVKDEGLMFGSAEKILRFGRDKFPQGVYEDSVLLTERKWVATSLPTMELTDALQYVAHNLRRAVDALDEFVGEQPADSRPRLGPKLTSAFRRSYRDISRGTSFSLGTKTVTLAGEDLLNPAERYGPASLELMTAPNLDFQARFRALALNAQRLFDMDGGHISIAILLDKDAHMYQILRSDTDDRATRLAFWIELGRVVAIDSHIHGIIHIAEAWTRSATGYPHKRIQDLEITGETLMIAGAFREGQHKLQSIPILRSDGHARLEPDESRWETTDELPNFLAPIVRAWTTADELAKNQK